MGADAAGDGAAPGASQVTEHYAEPVILPLRPASFSAKTNMIEDGHTQNTHCSLFFKKENRKGECNYNHANLGHSDLYLCINHLQLLIGLYWEQLLEKCLTSQSWVPARRAGLPVCMEPSCQCRLLRLFRSHAWPFPTSYFDVLPFLLLFQLLSLISEQVASRQL